MLQRSFSDITSDLVVDFCHPLQVPLLPVKNRTLKLQWEHAHLNRTVEDWKSVVRDTVTSWQQHESMDPSVLMSTVQVGGGVLVRGIFFGTLPKFACSPHVCVLQVLWFPQASKHVQFDSKVSALVHWLRTPCSPGYMLKFP